MSPDKDLQPLLTKNIAAVISGMTGEETGVAVALEPFPKRAADSLTIRYVASQLTDGLFWIEAGNSEWKAISIAILGAAPDSDSSELKETYLEVANQLASVVFRELSPNAGMELTPNPPVEGPARTTTGPSFRVEVTLPAGSPVVLFCGFNDRILARPALREPKIAEPRMELAGPPKTIDLLLDVELPVSISFGRAQLSLKDVIKLTSGSIVELNRALTEPVEVIVNNCVIARGEVVVVEGNYGVRINHIVSRTERLRTLH